MNNYILPLLLSTLAGLSTVLGGAITFFIKRHSMRTLSIGLGFSAGVMIFISLTELLPESLKYIREYFGFDRGWIVLAGFAAGMLIAVLIDRFVPDHIQDEEHFINDKDGENSISDEEDGEEKADTVEKCEGNFCIAKTKEEWQKLRRTGIVTALAVAIHNLPEGLATFFASSVDLKLGITVVLAIAIHNIPEGIAVALPVYQATGSKRKVFWYTLLSGLAEPVGGIIGFFIIKMLFPELAVGIMFSIVAGIMTYISFDTLLPLSKEYDTGHYSITGVVLGMLFIGATIFLF
jgi:ZIP family zinc transporter